MTIMRGRPRASACRQVDSAPTSTPSTALTTSAAKSAAASAEPTSPEKSAYPGVSIQLIFTPFHSVGANASWTLLLRSISSGS